MISHQSPRILAVSFRISLAVLSIEVFSRPLQAADFAAWSDTSDVFLDTSPGGINLGTKVLDFPLLVRLKSPDFPFGRARGQGQDIRFSNSSGTPLPHQIERWDSAGGRAEIWVLADTVHAGSATQRLRMYWGNPAAADSSDGGAVFPVSSGALGVWHLGAAGTGPRPNAVPGGNPAVPAAYDGDETRSGIIGLGDSLDGAAVGDYLDVGAGFADFTGGFTFSAWVRPAAVKQWGRLMDFGNGQAADNIIVGRDAATDNLALHVYHGVGPAHSRLNTPAFLALEEWQHVAVTVSPIDSSARAYRNGTLAWTGKLIAPISAANRTLNWLGRSHWPADEYFQGKLDEVRLARTVQDAARIRLAYESQREDAVLVSFRPPPRCQPAFAAPADTAVAEGGRINLAATAECAPDYSWSVASGLAVRILDPSVKTLSFDAPRVLGDTLVTFRFRAEFTDSAREALVRVRIREAIPEPRFTLPDSLAWNGRDSLIVIPAFSNLAAVKASRDSILAFAWTLEGLEADTAWRGQSLVLREPAGAGTGRVGLCVDNGGPPTCHSLKLGVAGGPTAIRLGSGTGITPKAGKAAIRVDGRLLGKPGTVTNNPGSNPKFSK